MQQITFNGKTYNNIDEMPANERQAFEHLQQIFVDANGNGIPDFMEGDMAKNIMTAFMGNVNFNGKVYNNLNDLPPEAREKVQKAFEKLKQMGLVADAPFPQEAAGAPEPFEPAFQPSKPLIPAEPASPTGDAKRWLVIAGVLVALLICSVGLAVAFFLMR